MNDVKGILILITIIIAVLIACTVDGWFIIPMCIIFALKTISDISRL